VHHGCGRGSTELAEVRHTIVGRAASLPRKNFSFEQSVSTYARQRADEAQARIARFFCPLPPALCPLPSALFLLGLYLGHQNQTAYGPAAALVLILIWVYYSALILFLGAEFTRTWADQHGRTPAPKRGAVRTDLAATGKA
jgi:Virulence factor BrkB